MHAKLGSVLTGIESPVVLSRAADIAALVPGYVLHIVRDLTVIDDVAQMLFDWHAPGSDVTSGGRQGRDQ